ncbi:MAG: helix-turn-helix transcriptional regulator [Lachnospiraceae bacterium]|nr:helix-turn-helix transcriptional regulator [Lachnospiraceae bacterium]
MEQAEKKTKEGIQLTVIETIESLMDENKINQATLARQINIGPAQLSKCLSRKGNNYFGIDMLIRISDYFKVPIDKLLGRTVGSLSKKSGSNTDICRQLVNLIETGTVNIINATVEENTYQPNKEASDNPANAFRYEKKKSPYKMFYFSNYRPLPNTKDMNKSEKKKVESELNANGLYHPKRIEINAFIEYYLKLQDLYKKGDLPQAFFEQAIEDRLNQMRY